MGESRLLKSGDPRYRGLVEATVSRWSEVEVDSPIAKLFRQRIFGEKALVAKIRLEAGCVIEPHSHSSEQVSILVSGRMRWKLGDNEEERITESGEVLVLPGGYRHGAVALEECHLFDILCPPGATGVDAQASR